MSLVKQRAAFTLALIVAGCSRESPPPPPPAVTTPIVKQKDPASSSIKIRFDLPKVGARVKLHEPIPFRAEVTCGPDLIDQINFWPIAIGTEMPMRGAPGGYALVSSFAGRIEKDGAGRLIVEGTVNGQYLPKNPGSYRLTITYGGPVSVEPGFQGNQVQPIGYAPYEVIP